MTQPGFIVLVTSNNLNAMLSTVDLIRHHGDRITDIVVTEGMLGGESRTAGMMRVLRESGANYAMLKLLLNVFLPLFLRLRGLPTSVTELMRRHGFQPRTIRCLRADEARVIEALARVTPDYLLSVGATHVFSPALLRVPSRAALNIHPTLLPAHAGRDPYVWPMIDGDAASGVTLHLMEPRVDAGDVILQERIELGSVRSVVTLMRHAQAASSRMLSRVFADPTLIERATRQNLAARSIKGSATRRDLARLYAHGRTLVDAGGVRQWVAAVRASVDGRTPRQSQAVTHT